MDSTGNLIGITGVFLVLAAYALLATGRLSPDHMRYQWLNIVGTTGILVSLAGHWNLPAFVANAAWIVVGLLALVRIHRKRRI